MACLIGVQTGSDEVQSYPLPEDKTYRVGRGEWNDLTLHDGQVSRDHLKILPHHEGYMLEDQKSANGTYVNGNAIGPAPYLLQDNDRITLGNPPRAIFWFRQGDETVRQSGIKNFVGEIDVAADFEVDLIHWQVIIDGKTPQKALPSREFCLLVHLWRNRPEACSMPDLKAAGWPYLDQGTLDTVDNKTLHTYIYRIRLYLRQNGLQRQVIFNVRGIGYRLEPHADAELAS